MKQRRFNHFSMRWAGRQLLEVIRNDFPLPKIIKMAAELNLKYRELLMLGTWLANEASTLKTRRILQKTYGIEISDCQMWTLFMKILTRLIVKIDLTPSFDAEGRLVQRYSFLDYIQTYLSEHFCRISTRINKEHYWTMFIHKSDENRLHRDYIMRKKDGKWVICDIEDLPSNVKSFVYIRKMFVWKRKPSNHSDEDRG
jgi:hypothetical protein